MSDKRGHSSGKLGPWAPGKLPESVERAIASSAFLPDPRLPADDMRDWSVKLRTMLEDVALTAAAVEREACARLVEEWCDAMGFSPLGICSAIRKRGAP